MAFLSFLAGTLGVLGAAGAYYRFLSPFLGFYLVLGAVVFIALNFPLNLVRFVKRGRRNVSAMGMLFGLIATAALGLVLKFAIENPVTDVTNSPASPPAFRHPASSIPVPPAMWEFIDPAFQLDRSYDASTYEIQSRAYPNIYVIDLPTIMPDNAFGIVESVVAKHPEWRKVRSDPENYSIELEEEMPYLRSVDDFVIQVVPANNNSSILLRSRSRFGFTDFGSNAKRIRQFSEEFAATAAAMTPPLQVEFRK